MRQESVAHRPHPALRGFVAAAVGYDHAGLPPGEHLGLPSPWLTVILTLDEPLAVAAHPDPTQCPGRFDALVGGLHTRPARIAHPGRQAGIQLSLTPAGARALLGVPAGAIASIDAHLDDLLGPAADELLGRVRAARGWAARFAAVEAVLLRRLRDEARVPDGVAEAWRLTTAEHGRLRVAEVARFDRARRTLAARASAGRPLDLAGLAAVAGFADQAHLTREWRAFSGLAPTRWLAAEFGYVQDTRTLDRALSGP